MFAKRLFHKAVPKHKTRNRYMASADVDLQIAVHYGIPYTASLLAFDPIQRLLAIGTLDGRIKIIGGDNIEGLLISPKKVPYKYLEFLYNHEFLVGVSNENEIQVWNLEFRQLVYCLQWEANMTAFAVVQGTYLMYIGDESGLFSVLKYNDEDGKLLKLPYHIPANVVTEAAGISFLSPQPIIGILPQTCTSGTRVLIAYENGLLILWDISEGQVVTVRGYTDLQLKDDVHTDSSTGVANELSGNMADNEEEEKEICSLCWASNTGSVLAVGYINGDILLWNMSSNSSVKGQQTGISSNSVVKLQLASGDRRLPVIVLHWSANGKADIDKGGQLFIYGGDEMGSEEVLTILSLEWSSGMETLRCISRVDLNLNGSFADMILVPNVGSPENCSTAALFVLTNPGQLHVYDGALLSMLTSEEKPSVQAEKFPDVVPTIDPRMTVTKLCLLTMDRNSSQGLMKKDYAKKLAIPNLSAGTKWPLTGGIPSEMSSDNYAVERIFIAGYEDGSVRMWDATYPILELMFVLESKVPGVKVDGENASVSALAFCSISMTLAVGDECGLVRVYKFHESTDGSTVHFVNETKHEVQIVHHGKGFHCIAAFSILNLHIRTLQFTNSGDRFAVGFEDGQVAMLDMHSLSVMFQQNYMAGGNSPVVCMHVHSIPQYSVPANSPKQVSLERPIDPAEVLLILTKDAHVVIIDSRTGDMITRQVHPKDSLAISMYVIEGSNAIPKVASEKFPQHISDDNSSQSETEKNNNPDGSKTQEVEQHCSSDTSDCCEKLVDPLLLLCCEGALWLYSLKSVIQGDSKFIHKVNLVKRCCWSTTFTMRDEKACRLILLYQTGDIEIRSLPGLEPVAEGSLMSILRWSFKTNMDKTMSSSDNGQIALVNGCELAFLSHVAGANDFRIPESLPCLHDKVLAAAAAAAINLSTSQKKKQSTAPGIFGGIMRGLKGVRTENNPNIIDSFPRYISSQQLEELFSRVPFSNTPTTTTGDPEVAELSIDDIEIDDVLPTTSTSTSSVVNKNYKIDEAEERKKLFEGSTSDMKPRMRTTQEILTQYRFAGDASAAAAHARDKLAQRQERLERLSQRTAELQSGAENFADMANELVKTMEKKRWWKI
ncbi:lethal(2) giant larvae protein homolog SRO77 isoform X2 [Elaeis guineensis]|uniref:Uncharacterized protein LOC105044594 isoform X3 n=1 Tax=Elaeis guineensis var. tenera TaxID=51953 RepID=A0A6J0PJ09_ELAGV|nr:uncharacterized protein LOC105044594 isoform X3 [Elaeis guineensis]